jgi:hypothetical protein
MYKLIVALVVTITLTSNIFYVHGQVPNPPNTELSLAEAADLVRQKGYDPYSVGKPVYTEEYEALRRLCKQASMCRGKDRPGVKNEHRHGKKECVDFDGAWAKTSLAGTKSMRVVCSELFKMPDNQ